MIGFVHVNVMITTEEIETAEQVLGELRKMNSEFRPATEVAELNRVAEEVCGVLEQYDLTPAEFSDKFGDREEHPAISDVAHIRQRLINMDIERSEPRGL